MLLLRKIQSRHVILFLIFFWITWLYTEVDDYRRRRDFMKEVDSFMHEGRRFTWEDGEMLKARIRLLEQAQFADDNHHKNEHRPIDQEKNQE